MDHQETEERGEIEMPLYFGVFVSLFAYLIGMELKKKFGWPVLNPLLVAIILVIAFLKATGITYTDYNEGASYISYFLTPATVCLAIPLYPSLPANAPKTGAFSAPTAAPESAWARAGYTPH